MTISIAVEGCCHGELNTIYRDLPPVDLLIICGDFQALRNPTDLDTLNVPDRYKHMRDFHQYYSGERTAPVPTIFVGGNHEALSYLQELRYGGWVAPNIYYMGESSTVTFRGVRILGILGIWSAQSFRHTREIESLPYNGSTLRLVYHVKPKAVVKMALQKYPDVVVSHDWPDKVHRYGNVAALLRKKRHFRPDIEADSLGSPVNWTLLKVLRPTHWFLAHLHTKFTATIPHERVPSRERHRFVAGADEIELDMDDSRPVTPRAEGAAFTEFLALDKCLPRRQFLEIIPMAPKSSLGLLLDRRLVAIDKVVESYIASHRSEWNALHPRDLTDPWRYVPDLMAELSQLVDYEEARVDGKALAIPEFVPHAPTSRARGSDAVPLRYWPNSQTIEYCERFGLPLCFIEGCGELGER